MSALAAWSRVVHFSEHSRGLDQDAESVSKIAANRDLKFWWDKADCFERACLARPHTCGAPPLRSGDQNALVVAFCRTAVVGLTQPEPSKTKKPRYREALLVLVGPGGLIKTRMPFAF